MADNAYQSQYRGGGSPTSRRKATSPYSHPELAPGAQKATPYNDMPALPPLKSMLDRSRAADQGEPLNKRKNKKLKFPSMYGMGGEEI